MSATATLDRPRSSSRSARNADRDESRQQPKEATAPARPGGFRLALLWTVLGLVLIGGLLALVFGPGRGMRTDIARQRSLLQSQLAITQQQLDLTKRQLSVTETQLGVTQEQLRIAEEQRQIATRQLGIAQEQLTIARTQLGKTDESLEVQRRLQAIAEQTLEQAREINRKTPNAAGPTSTVQNSGLPVQPLQP